MLPTGASHLFSPAASRKNVIESEMIKNVALNATKAGRCVMNTLPRLALPTPISESSAGPTQQGRVRKPAAAANRAL